MRKNKKAICCIGHITLDKIITPAHTVYLPGGTAYYFGHAMASLGDRDFTLLTSLGEKEMPAVDHLRERGVEVTVIPSRYSVFFENSYTEDTNRRTQRVLAKADPFTIRAIEGTEAEIFHLGTLLADDFPHETIPFLAARGKVSVDAQGFLREVRGDKVLPVDWNDKEILLPYITYLKANEDEARMLTGTADPAEAARILGEMGVKEVIVTLGDKGSLILSEGEMHEIAAFPVERAVDATGCGDTYMAGYLHRRVHGASIDDAGHFAAAMCTFKIMKSGPFTDSEAAVNALVSKSASFQA